MVRWLVILVLVAGGCGESGEDGGQDGGARDDSRPMDDRTSPGDTGGMTYDAVDDDIRDLSGQDASLVDLAPLDDETPPDTSELGEWQVMVSGKASATVDDDGAHLAVARPGDSVTIRSSVAGWALTSRPRFTASILLDAYDPIAIEVGLANEAGTTLAFAWDGLPLMLRVLGGWGVETFDLETPYSLGIELVAEVMDAGHVAWEVRFPDASLRTAGDVITLAAPISDAAPARFFVSLSSAGEAREILVRHVEITQQP